MVQIESNGASAPRSQAGAENASPRPWKFEPVLSFGEQLIIGADDFEIATIYCSDGMDEMTHLPGAANAAFIVKAVNSYYAMVEALEKIAAMDPKGIRADDLGRAARIAAEGIRDSVSSQKEPPRHSGEQS